MPKSAHPQTTAPPKRASAAPAFPAAPAPTNGTGSPNGALRRTLLVFALIVVAGIVPMILMGEVLGWWVLSRSVPFLAQPHSGGGLPFP
jgi:hypothetical protein